MKKVVLLFLCVFLVSCNSAMPDMNWLVEENRASFDEAGGGKKETSVTEDLPLYEEFFPKDWDGPTVLWSMMDIVPRGDVPFPFEEVNAFLEKRDAPYRIALLKIRTMDQEQIGKAYAKRLLPLLDEKGVDLINLGAMKPSADDEFATLTFLEQGLLEQLPKNVTPYSDELSREDKLYAAGNPRVGNRIGIFIPNTREIVDEGTTVFSALKSIGEHQYKATFDLVGATDLMGKLMVGHFFVLHRDLPVFFWESENYIALAKEVEVLWEKELLSTSDPQADIFFCSGFTGDIRHSLSGKEGKFTAFFLSPRESSWYRGGENSIYIKAKQKDYALEFLTMLYKDKELAKVFALTDDVERLSDDDKYFLPTFTLFNELLLASEETLDAIDQRSPEERGYHMDSNLEAQCTRLYEQVLREFPEDWDKIFYMKPGWRESTEMIKAYLEKENIKSLQDKLHIDYRRQRRAVS